MKHYLFFFPSASKHFPSLIRRKSEKSKRDETGEDIRKCESETNKYEHIEERRGRKSFQREDCISSTLLICCRLSHSLSCFKVKRITCVWNTNGLLYEMFMLMRWSDHSLGVPFNLSRQRTVMNVLFVFAVPQKSTVNICQGYVCNELGHNNYCKKQTEKQKKDTEKPGKKSAACLYFELWMLQYVQESAAGV